MLLYIHPTNPKRYNASTARRYLWFKDVLAQQRERGQMGCATATGFELGVATLGHHTCVCGAPSEGQDILLPNHTATHTLAYHYIAYHADEVPAAEWAKLDALRRYVEYRITREHTFSGESSFI